MAVDGLVKHVFLDAYVGFFCAPDGVWTCVIGKIEYGSGYLNGLHGNGLRVSNRDHVEEHEPLCPACSIVPALRTEQNNEEYGYRKKSNGCACDRKPTIVHEIEREGEIEGAVPKLQHISE